MRAVLITQDEPLFLAPGIDDLLSRLPDGVEIVGCIVFDPSPIGRKLSLIDRARTLIEVFGPAFFIRYAGMFALRRLNPASGLSPVLARHGVPELRIEGRINAPENLDRIRALTPDLLVSIAGNQIFKRPLIDLAPRGCLNLHTALLPRYRGLMPTFWVLKNGERETGVSVFFVDDGIDSGPILVQKRVPIETCRLETLIRQTKQLGMDAVLEALVKVRDGGYQLMPNAEAEMSYFGFPTAADVKAFRAAGKRLF